MWTAWLLLMLNGLFFTLRLANNTGSFPPALSREEEQERAGTDVKSWLKLAKSMFGFTRSAIAHDTRGRRAGVGRGRSREQSAGVSKY